MSDWYHHFQHHFGLLIAALIAMLSFHQSTPVLVTSHVTPSPVIRPSVHPAITVSPVPLPSVSATPLQPLPHKSVPAPTTSTVDVAQITPTTLSAGYGIAAGSSLPNLSVAELNARLDQMRALGVGWVRFDLDWSQIQANGPDSYDWSAPDRIVSAATSRGLRPLMIIDYTPTWAQSSMCTGNAKCEPADPATFGRFASAAASRYSSQGVQSWEIWNEENTAAFFAPAADPAAYTKLLQVAYRAIKAVNSSATVLTGGTAPTGNTDGNMIAPNFLTGIYADGGKGYFDAVAHHPYVFPATPTTGSSTDAWSQLGSLHAIMTANGDGTKKIWATEFGAPTGGPGPAASIGTWDQSPLPAHDTETLQATYAVSGVNAWKLLPFAGPMFWYSLQDAGTSQSTSENFFGLLRADGSQKPAYNAFKSAISGS